MLVPRSFKYSSPPATPTNNTRPILRNTSRDKLPATPDANQRSPRAATESRSQTPPPPTTTITDDMMRKPSRPVDVPSPEKARFSGSKTMGHSKGPASSAGKKKDQLPAQHRADALSPSVAALLAMTTIPRRQRQTQRRSSSKRQVSIDELVNEWKSDDSLVKSYESSPLSILLESADEHEEPRSSSLQSELYHRASYERSESSDSVPSLEGDANSMFSMGSPATPTSMRSRKSSMVRKESPRTPCIRESCVEDHPLIPLPHGEEDELDFTTSHDVATGNKPKSSFKSNLTTSLQALKLAALSSFTPRKTTSFSLRGRRSSANAAVAAAMRQREPRENSDFLRVVVLEMNMRREGKLEMGRAKIWLPPRQSVESDVAVQGKVPRRWIGVSAQ